MTRKHWLLLGAALALGCISFYLNSDWFRSENIQIVHRPVQERLFRNRKPPRFGEVRTIPVLFDFDRKLALTDVQVVDAAEYATNKYAHPLWHLTSNSNSLPTKGIIYGMLVPGMRPAVKDATPDPCLPGIKYKLIVKAGDREATHDFTVNPAK